MALLVIFETKDDQTRKVLVSAVAHYGGCIKVTESIYALKTDQAPEQVYQGLRLHLKPSDRVLVVPLTKPFTGTNGRVKQWLDENLPEE